mgnify:CR=1 FL=1
MEIIDCFLEKSKNKFLNNLVKIPKQYDWYLGLVFHLDSDDIITNEEITERCTSVYEKSDKHLQLLKICLIDDHTLLLFGIDPVPFNSNIVGIIKSICRYLDCPIYSPKYMKNFGNMVIDVWGEQKYKYLIADDRAYDLQFVGGEN